MIFYTFYFLYIQIWFQNRRARHFPKPPKPSPNQHQYQDVYNPAHPRGMQPQEVTLYPQKSGAPLPVSVGGPLNSQEVASLQRSRAWYFTSEEKKPMNDGDPPRNQHTTFFQPCRHYGPREPLPVSFCGPPSDQKVTVPQPSSPWHQGIGDTLSVTVECRPRIQQARYPQAPSHHGPRYTQAPLVWNQQEEFLCDMDFLENEPSTSEWPPVYTVGFPPPPLDAQ